MLIEIQCSNHSVFDAATGRFRVCGHRWMVDSSQIGAMVTCPSCEEPLEVSRPEPPKSAESASNPTAPKTKAAPAKGNVQPNQGSPKRKVASSVKKNDVMELQFAEDQLEPSFAGNGTRCKKCGSPAPYGRCTVCRFVEPRFKNMHLPIDEIKMQPAGMQLWLSKTLSEGMSASVLATIGHVCAVVPILLGLLVAVLSLISGSIVGGLIALVFVITLLLTYLSTTIKAYQFLRNPRTQLGFFQKPFWNFILWLARRGNWENYDQRLKGRRVVKVNERGFTDAQLETVEGIRTAQVLDLENTQVSDRCVAVLYRLEHLQCLVLRKTNVTHDAVVRLQQTFPKLWIWY